MRAAYTRISNFISELIQSSAGIYKNENPLNILVLTHLITFYFEIMFVKSFIIILLKVKTPATKSYFMLFYHPSYLGRNNYRWRIIQPPVCPRVLFKTGTHCVSVM